MKKRKKRLRGVALYTKMLKKRVRILDLDAQAHDIYAGRAGLVVNVYLVPSGLRYTVMLRDGRLVERDGEGIVVEG